MIININLIILAVLALIALAMMLLFIDMIFEIDLLVWAGASLTAAVVLTFLAIVIQIYYSIMLR